MAPRTVFLTFAERDELFRDLFTTQWSRAGDQARSLDSPGTGRDRTRGRRTCGNESAPATG